MTRTLFYVAALAIAQTLSAQEHSHEDRSCAAHTFTQRLLAEQGLSTDIQAHLPRPDNIQRGGTYTIPVVVHVVWNTAAENVPTSAITAIIDEMNRDYSQTNPDLGGVRAPFVNSIGNVGFQFCLAQVDPTGAATTGITRTQTTDTWFDPDTQTNDMKSAPLGKTPWNPSQYLNIWICDITSGATGGTITVGYAYLPVGGVVGTGIDGLVIDYNYGLDVGARTATHEIGHYFGLQHTFDDGGNCTNTDGFADTPTSNSPTFSCANTNLMKCGVLTQYENFMDYSSCTVMFTDQQSSYMQGILTGVRSGLLNNNVCSGTPTGVCIPTSVQGTADGDYINGVQLGSINNTNSGGTGGPSYTDYTSTFSTSLTRGSTYTISIQSGNYTPDQYSAWIDMDQDEVFEAGEKLGEFTNTAIGQTQSFTFTVPVGAALGNTVLRVRGVYHNTGEPTPTDPCFSYAYGETEDYGITITSPVTGPCIPTSAQGTADGDYINGVQLGSINNTNSGGTGGPSYTDYTSTFSTSLTRGSTYTISIQSGNYTPDQYSAWIDMDQDEVFEASEKLGEFTNTAIGQTQSFTFTVPVGAALGNTVLRVRGVYHNTGEPTPTDPCFNYAYGETEDYGIVITSPVTGPCIPTSAQGTADGDFINGVQLGSILNTNSGGVGGPSYTDYTASFSTSLTQGNTYLIAIQAGDYDPDQFSAWIDMDQDDVFEASEKLGEFTNTAAGEVQTFTFTVPAGAVLGNTILRVRGVYHGTGEPAPTDPCFNYAYGETEDYRIIIVAPGSGPCIPTSIFGTTDGDFVNSVELEAISNVNSGSITGPTYTDYTAVYTTGLVRGGEYALNIGSGDYAPDNYAAWIDLDQDNSFEASEKLGEFATTVAGASGTITFTIPVDAPLGTTTMRVRGVFHATGEPTPTDPCFDYAYGETEDYGVTIELSTAVGQQDGSGYLLMPNPASEQCVLLTPAEGAKQIIVLDMQGRAVLELNTMDQRIDLPLNGLSNGHYVVRIMDASGSRNLRLERVR